MPVSHRHLAALAALLSLARVEPAWACGSLPCAVVKEVQPALGSVSVPRNPELRVLYFGSRQPLDPSCQPDFTALRLRPPEGAPIELTGTLQVLGGGVEAWLTARVDEPLAPYVTYALEVPIGADGLQCRCDGPGWTTVSSFTTGLDEDHEAPDFDGLDGVSYEATRVSTGVCPGIPQSLPIVTDFRPPSDDAQDELRYDVYVDGELARPYVRLAPGVALPDRAVFLDCEVSPGGSTHDVAPGSSLELRAVDAAGNESAAHDAVLLASSCEAAQQPDESWPAPASLARGCALAPRRPEMPCAPVALGALFALACWRRNRRRSAARAAARDALRDSTSRVVGLLTQVRCSARVMRDP